jgi:hypothetical protein
VRLLDRFNRYRFANDANMLAGWESASNVVVPVHSAGNAQPAPETPAPPSPAPTSGSEVRPAA